jgi:hypothetical protein
MSQHEDYHYSITIKTDDEAVLHCLRALSQYSQKSGNVRIPWGGTKREDWMVNNQEVTFHFSRPEYRKEFQEQVERLFTSVLYKVVKKNDKDPAKPQD